MDKPVLTDLPAARSGETSTESVEDSRQEETTRRTTIRKRKHKGHRSANGSGTVWKQDGKYRWQITVGTHLNGKPIVVSGREDTIQEAELKKAQAIADFSRKLRALPTDTTLAQQAEVWLERQYLIMGRTVATYRRELGYALKYLGHKRLVDIEVSHIKNLPPLLLRERVKHDRPLARSTLARIFVRLRAVFREAISDRLIYADPMAGFKLRLGSRQDNGEEQKALARLQADRLYLLGTVLFELELCRLWPALFLGMAMGLRRGEIMGLQWKDIDFSSRLLQVNRARVMDIDGLRLSKPKTANSRRGIPMPAPVVNLLLKHRERQLAERQQSVCWNEQDIVFATETGEWTHVDNLNRSLRRIIRWSDPARLHEAEGKNSPWQGVPIGSRPLMQAVILAGEKLPNITPHSLRHTYATLALRERGNHPSVTEELISKHLGHTSPAFTLSFYRHVLDDERRSVTVDLFPETPELPVIERGTIN